MHDVQLVILEYAQYRQLLHYSLGLVHSFILLLFNCRKRNHYSVFVVGAGVHFLVEATVHLFNVLTHCVSIGCVGIKTFHFLKLGRFTFLSMESSEERRNNSNGFVYMKHIICVSFVV